MDGRTGKWMDGQTDRWVMEGFLLPQSPTVRCLNLTVFFLWKLVYFLSCSLNSDLHSGSVITRGYPTFLGGIYRPPHMNKETCLSVAVSDQVFP